MSVVAITGGRIHDADGERPGTILVDSERGVIDQIVDDGVGSAEVHLDASGCLVLPGFVDLHAHLREPGNEAAETIETGSRSAALGGYTAVVAMPNTNPCMDSAAVVNEVLALGSKALCEIKPSAAITVGRQGEELAPMAELVRLGVRMFTDDGTGVQDDQLMRSALEYASSLSADDGADIVLSQHCEVNALSQPGVMHEGAWSAKLGLAGQPSEAEELMVMRDIALARLTGMNVHLQHLSTAGSVEMVRRAKQDGVPVTAEATPHHFTLSDAECSSYDPVFKVHPPLRTEADVAAIRVGLADGTIDAVATDHAPHTPDSKELPFDEAPPGMLGLETAFALALTELELPISRLIELFSTVPARIGGLATQHGRPVQPGEPANLTIVAADETWTVSGESMASLARNTPFEGRQLRGKVRHTVFDGEPVVINSKAVR